MAKRKRTKDSGKKFQYSVELYGLLLILIAIIGSAPFGPVGKIIKDFEIFLMGNYYIIVFALILSLGIYMVVKRKLPKFFTSRLIGLYIIIIVILTLSHTMYIENEGASATGIIQTTIDNFMEITSDVDSTMDIGGGILGAIFSWAFISLFEVRGTNVVLIVLAVFGIVMLFDITLADVFAKIKLLLNKIKNREKKEKIKINPSTDESETHDEDKIVISSVDDLKIHENKVAEQHEEPSQEPINIEPGKYVLPPISLLNQPAKKDPKYSSTEFLKSNKNIIERVLNDFQINGKVVNIHEGPAVTQYEIDIKAGTKLSRITSINKELALALAARDVRIQAPIPGKNTVGIETPNKVISSVAIREVLGNVPKYMESAKVLVALGKDIMGNIMMADLNKMPHLLVAGSTGSGKSVCINSFIASILMRRTPEEVKLVLVDPKKVELSHYNGIPHLLCPVVTDPKKASYTLKKIVDMMDKRYELFSEHDCKNIETYNQFVEQENKRRDNSDLKPLCYIVVIIDELADLMLIAAKEVEDSIMRITQMARAAGIHLIVATQRPSTDVITGIVKANIPSRISFAVSSQIDSRTILDMGGAEKLLGKGDMLYLPMGENIPIRIQGTFISDDETKKLIEFVCKNRKANYDDSIMKEEENPNNTHEKEEYDDPLYNEIVEFAINTGKISASLLQRRFRLGYNRAARIVDLLEERGIIGPQNGSKPREVLVKLENKD